MRPQQTRNGKPGASCNGRSYSPHKTAYFHGNQKFFITFMYRYTVRRRLFLVTCILVHALRYFQDNRHILPYTLKLNNLATLRNVFICDAVCIVELVTFRQCCSDPCKAAIHDIKGAHKSLARPGRNKLQRQKILMFIYPIYNHNWRNSSTIYIYTYIYKTRLASNEIFSPSNKIHGEGSRAKDLTAPLYSTGMLISP